MSAGTPETPVFAASGQAREHLVRALAGGFALLLLAWLAAIATGIVGFGGLPGLLPAAGSDSGASTRGAHHTTPAIDSSAEPAAQELAAELREHGSAPRPGASSAKAATSTGSSPAVASPSTVVPSGSVESSQGSAAGSTTTPPGTSTGTGATGTGATTAGAAPDHAQGGDHAPAYTPPTSGEQRADPARGKSALAPGAVFRPSAGTSSTG